MKTMEQLEHAATMYGGRVLRPANGLPAVDFGAYGLESTEADTHGGTHRYGGFRYYGLLEHIHRPEVTACFNFLALPVVKKELLTIARAQELMGRTVRLSYCDVNEGDYTIILDGMEDEPANGMVGQGDTCKRLRFRELLPEGEKPGTWIYEWQGIFRRGSGAERLYVEEVKP